MKRTDKYRDSYQYDNQNQNHRRQSEDASYRQQYAKGDPEEHPERYYNGRDYRREQILEEENEKSRRSKKWLYIIIAILLIIVAIFVTRAILNNDSDKVSNDPKVSQNYKKQVENQDGQINKLTEANNALKNNASQGKIESMLNDINTKFDSIKSKLESLFKDDNGGAN
ncbi:TPA: hypothetical protein ACGAJN_000867 [Staphylococcus aureus]